MEDSQVERSTLLRVLLAMALLGAVAAATPIHLRCEYQKNPLGIDALTPHLSWQSDNSERNWEQTAYQLLIASSLDRLRAGQGDVLDSGKTDSEDSVGIPYSGPPLESRKRYYWSVRVWDARGQVFQSTEEAWWEMGPLHPTDWQAKWVFWKNPDDEVDRAAIRWIWLPNEDSFAVTPKRTATFRTGIKLSAKPKEAMLVLAARGSFVAKVNGRVVDSKHGWGSFDQREISTGFAPCAERRGDLVYRQNLAFEP